MAKQAGQGNVFFPHLSDLRQESGHVRDSRSASEDLGHRVPVSGRRFVIVALAFNQPRQPLCPAAGGRGDDGTGGMMDSDHDKLSDHREWSDVLHATGPSAATDLPRGLLDPAMKTICEGNLPVYL